MNGRAVGYVQAIPLYLPSDVDVAAYFKDHRQEVDELTGKNITIIYADEVVSGSTKGIFDALDEKGNPRFPGLNIDDLPCLWIEDENERAAFFSLQGEVQGVKIVLRQLAAVVRHQRDAVEIVAALQRKSDAAVTGKFGPLLDAISRKLGELNMDKSKERMIALVCGVIFVAAILVIALVIKEPSGFQYTVFRIVLAVAAAGFVAMTPGFIEAKIGNWLRAGGAFAVFAIVYFFAPAALGVS